MMFYLDMGENDAFKTRMTLAFSIGIFSLIVSIVLFTVPFLMIPPLSFVTPGPD